METTFVTGLIFGLAAGLAVGIAGSLLWQRLGGGSAPDRDAKRREANYRREVADHFVETAQLVNRLTDSYKEVFDHLRDGAGKLVDEETLRQRLAHEEDKDVTLHLIGYRVAEEQSGEDKTSAAGKPRGNDKRRGEDTQ